MTSEHRSPPFHGGMDDYQVQDGCRQFLKRAAVRLCVAAAVVAAPAFAAAQAPLKGRVLSVSDGDTITVQAGARAFKVRLSGIDAPEKGQPYGQVARENLARLLRDQDVEVRTSKRDRYGRSVGVVTVNGRDAGLAQIESGLAWHYTAYAREQSPENRSRYAAAEAQAREAHRGLWRELTPTPPWVWRHRPR